MVALIGLGYVQAEQHWLAVLLLCIAVGSNAATYLGFQANHIDLAPNYAGTLMGITNCVANIVSIIAPLAVGFVVQEEVGLIIGIFFAHYFRESNSSNRTDGHHTMANSVLHRGVRVLCWKSAVCYLQPDRVAAVERCTETAQ